MVSTRRTPHLKAVEKRTEEGERSSNGKEMGPTQDMPHQEPTASTSGAVHAETRQPVHALTTAATAAAGSNAQLVFEMQRKWRKPRSLLARLRLFLRTTLFRTDYILGAYFFDWWETAIVYSLYFVLLIGACWGAYKQLHNLYTLGFDFYMARWGGAQTAVQ